MNNPYNFEQINLYNSVVSPSTVHVKNTGLARFFKRYLLQEAFSPFRFTLPEWWEKNYFLYVLFVIGHVGVINTDKYGVIPQHGTPSGFNVQYNPYKYYIANPLLRTDPDGYIIDEQIAVIKLQPDWCGLYDIVDFYGDLMALTAETAGVNILNSKLSYIFGAKNKAAAESMKKMYDNVASGEPAVFVDKDLFNEDGALNIALLSQNVGENYIADKLLYNLRDIKNMFLTDVGIANANTMKRERLISDEVNANNFETQAKVRIWLETLEKGMNTARDMFGISEADLNVRLREEVEYNGYTVNTGDV